MLADDDMTTGLAVHTDVDEVEDIKYHQPMWLFARDRAELAEEQADLDNVGDGGHDPIHGCQHKHDDDHSEEPLP